METNELASRYPDSPHTVQPGNEFQDLVCTELGKRGIVFSNFVSKKYQLTVGENIQGFEIKLDNRFPDTRQLSIEIAEKSARDRPNWTPSGIYKQDNTWLYIQGCSSGFYIFAKSLLLLLHKDKKKNYKEYEHNGTIKKFHLPLSDADKYCALYVPIS